MNKGKLFWVVSMPMWLTACLTNPAVQVPITQAPEVAEAASYRSIAVARFPGQYGDSMAASIGSSMMNARIQNKPVYRSVERLPESRVLAGGDLRALLAAAKAQGSDAVLAGEVLTSNVRDERSTKDEYVCTSEEKSNKLFKKCLSGYNKKVSCTDRIASLRVNLRLIDVKTGSQVYSESIAKSTNSKGCGDEKVDEPATLIGQLHAAVVNDVMVKIVPHERTVSLTLMPADKFEGSPVSKERFAGAVKFAEEKRMDRACETFRDLYASEKESVALSYNLGVCEEAEGHLARASELYGAADRLSTAPDKLVNEALARIEPTIRRTIALGKVRADLPGANKVVAGAAPTTLAGKKSSQSVSAAALSALPMPEINDEVMLTGRRSALVIGNAKYRFVSTLTNPVNDSRAMADELRKSGFEVVAVENADFAKMNLAIEQFANSIKEGGAALVFYAGHGFQVKGENYLVPIDANIKGESDVASKAVNLGQVLSKLEDGKSSVNVVILDACRDNPFAGSWRSAAGSGLASINAPSGTVIAFATAPGKTASDGSAGNGLFTSHLLKQLRQPNQKLEEVLKNTRKGVAAASNNGQIPWDSSSLTGDFYFRVENPNSKSSKAGKGGA